MKKCLIMVQCGLLLLAIAIGSGCVIVPANPRPHTVVVHRPPVPPPPPAPVVVVERQRPVPPPVVVVDRPETFVPPPVVVVETPRPQPQVVVVEKPRPAPPVVVHTPKPRPVTPAPVVVHARTPNQTVVIINSSEREVIRQYVVSTRSNRGHGHGDDDGKRGGKKDKGLPPGLAKKVERGGSLPPGWQKKCVRGQTMQMEVFKHCEPLPQEVLVQLPPPPAGTVIVTIEGKVVRLMQATLEILDVFDVI